MHIQLRLAAQEIVHVILAAPRIPCPSGASEYRLPVIWRGAVRFCIRPNVPVGFSVIAIGSTFSKPGVQIGRVRINLVYQDFEVEIVCFGNQRVEICERTEYRIDPAIIGYIITEVLHGRREERR